jgi:fermentation-respiration switch protein FrsA (DUF1100 family)
LLSLVAGALLAEGALHPFRRALIPAAIDREELQVKADGASLANVSIAAQDGVALQAWYLRPQHGIGDAVILFHGMGDNRFGMTGYADLFLRHGYSVLMPDSRALGESGGAIATYGLLESNDIRRWFEWLTAAQLSRCVYGFGESMGAAQLLYSLRAEPHFCAVDVECPFATFREIAYDRMGQRFHTGPWLGRTLLRPMVESAFLYARWKYAVDLQQVSPEGSAAATQVPVFLIHGQNDNNIPIRHSKRIAAKNSRAVLWEVPNTGHCGAIDTAPLEFENRLVGWFKSHGRS